MKLRQLGRSGLKVSELGFGTTSFGSKPSGMQSLGEVGQAEADRLVSICVDAGVTLFDTADIYAEGLAEEILGKAIRKYRHSVVIATKVGLPTTANPHRKGASRKHLIEACDASLRRLGTDWIDLYQLHAFDADTPLEETFRALDDLVTAGKIRYIGCSNYSAWQLMKAIGLARSAGYEVPAAHQVYYSLVGRDFEHELMPLALDQGVGTIVWSPLAGGYLGGKYGSSAAAPVNTRLAEIQESQLLIDPTIGAAAVEECRSVAAVREVSPGQVAINWLLGRASVSAVLIGAKNEAQLRDNLATVQWRLSAAEVSGLDASTETRVPYPQWHQASRFSLGR